LLWISRLVPISVDQADGPCERPGARQPCAPSDPRSSEIARDACLRDDRHCAVLAIPSIAHHESGKHVVLSPQDSGSAHLPIRADQASIDAQRSDAPSHQPSISRQVLATGAVSTFYQRYSYRTRGSQSPTASAVVIYRRAALSGGVVRLTSKFSMGFVARFAIYPSLHPPSRCRLHGAWRSNLGKTGPLAWASQNRGLPLRTSAVFRNSG
jgi:hypothetical protein